MRLSWPRENDKKRAIMAELPEVIMRERPRTNLFFINTTWRDVEVHRHRWPQLGPLLEAASNPELCRQPQLVASHMDLLHYCKF